MRKSFSVFAIALLLMLPLTLSPSTAGPADETIAATLAKWADAFAKIDVDSIAALYSKDALFFGSTPPLYRGVDGVRAYFKALPLKTAKVEFSDVTVVPVGTDVINVAAIASFTLNDAPAPRVLRLTWVLVREGDVWKIISHHASPK